MLKKGISFNFSKWFVIIFLCVFGFCTNAESMGRRSGATARPSHNASRNVRQKSNGVRQNRKGKIHNKQDLHRDNVHNRREKRQGFKRTAEGKYAK